MRRAVFLDRDGVINRATVRDGRPYPPDTLGELEILPGVREALSALKVAGYLLIVVTNQPDVATGKQSRAIVEEMHRMLRANLPLDDIRACFETDSEACRCYKPKPGMLTDAAANWNIDLRQSYMVGDRWRDIGAGKAAGTATIFIDYGYKERQPDNPDIIVRSLAEAAEWILSSAAPKGNFMLQKRSITNLNIKVFADGADVRGMLEMYKLPYIRGFTTNPTLMRKAGITNYRAFAREVLSEIKDRPISFEVFADEFQDMERQALEIASWGKNVNVKIPVTNTRAQSSASLVGRLSRQGVVVNVTAMFTPSQVEDITAVLDPNVPAILSIFAGRIADTGLDPIPLMSEAIDLARARPLAEVLWASPRELLNIFQANDIGCHIITVTNDVLKKLEGVGKDLPQFSRETVEMFFRDARAAGYSIN